MIPIPLLCQGFEISPSSPLDSGHSFFFPSSPHRRVSHEVYDALTPALPQIFSSGAISVQMIMNVYRKATSTHKPRQPGSIILVWSLALFVWNILLPTSELCLPSEPSRRTSSVPSHWRGSQRPCESITWNAPWDSSTWPRRRSRPFRAVDRLPVR